MQQGQLFNDERWQRLFGDVSPKLLAAFRKFHLENPKIFQLFMKFAKEAQAAGRDHFSHWMIINRIRWYCAVETTGSDFKISNDYIAIYVRLAIWQDDSLEGLFTLKKCKKNRKVRKDPENRLHAV